MKKNNLLELEKNLLERNIIIFIYFYFWKNYNK